MQNKSNVVFQENQENQASMSLARVNSRARVNPVKILATIQALEAAAGSILRGVGRRTVVISVFPHNTLNESYRHKNELALTEYGRLMATASYLRDKFGFNKKPVAVQQQLVQNVASQPVGIKAVAA